MGIIIADLDDTIASAAHREHLIKGEKKDWLKFNSMSNRDKPNMQVVVKLRQMAKQGHDIHILTGRSEIVRQQTIAWLQQHQIPYKSLKMRPASSKIKSQDLKRNWLKELDTKEVIAAIDDKKENLNMFKAFGIKAYHVRDGKIQGNIMTNKFVKKAEEIIEKRAVVTAVKAGGKALGAMAKQPGAAAAKGLQAKGTVKPVTPKGGTFEQNIKEMRKWGKPGESPAKQQIRGLTHERNMRRARAAVRASGMKPGEAMARMTPANIRSRKALSQASIKSPVRLA